MFPDPSALCKVIPSPRPFIPLPCKSSSIELYEAQLAAEAIKKAKEEACCAKKPDVWVTVRTKSSSELTMENTMKAAAVHTRIGPGLAVPFSEVIMRNTGEALSGCCGSKSMPVDEKICDCKGRLP